MVVRVRVRLIWITRCFLYKTAPEAVIGYVFRPNAASEVLIRRLGGGVT